MNENIITISGMQCYEKDGTAYLNLEAVARGLGFTQEKSGIEYVRWETVFNILRSIGFSQLVGKETFIPENIFYRLAMKAKNETAEKFQALVADEIIPSIRKHGAYMTDDTLQAAIANPDYLLKIVTALKEETDKRKALEAANTEMYPKAVFANAVAASNSAILVGELAKLLKQNGVENMGEKRLFQWMRDNGYLIKRNGTDYNMPTQRSMERGLFRIKETAVSHADGHVTVSKTPKVTGAGQQYFVNIFIGEGENVITLKAIGGK